ncbi:MerR family transcriptional regulator [Sphingorhabdus sp.]|uniref:MerR family transcriptional regulator n=1 Tax=Sphingorhabdus sp. TaxID=1902408 RepID=UPI003919097F
MNAMSIGKLAKSADVGVETVRYYQRRGLLGVPSRNGGMRRYDGEDLSRLRFVRQAQSAGFTLNEIGELLALDASDDRERARALAMERLGQIDQRIAELQTARAALAQLAQSCADESAGPCPIIQAFDRGVVA